jgi:hypothetical protein
MTYQSVDHWTQNWMIFLTDLSFSSQTLWSVIWPTKWLSYCAGNRGRMPPSTKLTTGFGQTCCFFGLPAPENGYVLPQRWWTTILHSVQKVSHLGPGKQSSVSGWLQWKKFWKACSGTVCSWAIAFCKMFSRMSSISGPARKNKEPCQESREPGEPAECRLARKPWIRCNEWAGALS